MAMWICLLFITVLGVAAVATEGPGSFPYLVEFVHVDDDNRKSHSCNGVIIKNGNSKTFFLSAAHCTITRSGFKTPNRVYVGDYTTRPMDISGATFMDIPTNPTYYANQAASIQPVVDPDCIINGHPCFDPHDTCLLKISGDYGNAIPIFTGSISELIGSSTQDCWITAWQETSAAIKKIKVTIEDGTELQQTLPNLSDCASKWQGRLSKHTICTNTNLCLESGISGGPLVCYHDNKYQLVAIVSLGATFPDGSCMPGFNAVHTLVNDYLPKITLETGPLS